MGFRFDGRQYTKTGEKHPFGCPELCGLFACEQGTLASSLSHLRPTGITCMPCPPAAGIPHALAHRYANTNPAAYANEHSLASTPASITRAYTHVRANGHPHATTYKYTTTYADIYPGPNANSHAQALTTTLCVGSVSQLSQTSQAVPNITQRHCILAPLGPHLDP